MYQSENLQQRVCLLEFLSPLSPQFKPPSQDHVSDARDLTVALRIPPNDVVHMYSRLPLLMPQQGPKQMFTNMLDAQLQCQADQL